MNQLQFKGGIDHGLLQQELIAAIGTQESAGWYLSGAQGEVTFIATKGTTPDPTAIIEAHIASAPKREYNKQVLASIDAIETETKVPRVVREMMLTYAEDLAQRTADELAAAGTPVTAEQLLMQNVAYVKTKAIDDQIRQLRSQLK